MSKQVAQVMLISKSGKSMFVNVKLHKFDDKGISGYCLNPNEEYKKGDIIEDFPAIEGTESRELNGKVMTTKKGEPLSFLIFKA